MERPDPTDLRHTAPLLHGIAKGDPFVVPDGFFERFPHQVQGLVAKPRQRAFLPWKRAAIALPLLVLLGIGIFRWADDGPTDGTSPAALALDATDLSDADLEEADLHELFLATNDTVSPWASIGLDLSDSEFLAYAEHEGIDLSELIDHP